MSIRQLDYRCWELSNPGTEEDREHFPDKSRADAAVARMARDDPESKASASLLASPCWVAECDDCGQVIDEEGEGYTVHRLSRAEAEETAGNWEWTLGVSAAGGERAWCPMCSPEDAKAPPPSAGQQEAAGQMALPGLAGSTS